jgi:hypothetical protein
VKHDVTCVGVGIDDGVDDGVDGDGDADDAY